MAARQRVYLGHITRFYHGLLRGIADRMLLVCPLDRPPFRDRESLITFPFRGVPAHLFANGFHDVSDLFGKEMRDLERQLYDASDNAVRVQIVDRYLLGRLRSGLYDVQFTGRCLPALLVSGDVGRTLVDFNVTYKTLELRFELVLGVTPSEMLKIKRFNAVVHMMYACRHDSLTRIGQDCGYYDQSHFIREFKQLTGYTPRLFLREQFTIVQA